MHFRNSAWQTLFAATVFAALCTGCKKSSKDSADPTPGPGSTFTTGVPEVVSVHSNGLEAGRGTITYNTDNLMASIETVSIEDNSRTTQTASYNTDKTLNQVVVAESGNAGERVTISYRYEGGLLRYTTSKSSSVPYTDTTYLTYQGTRLVQQLAASHYMGYNSQTGEQMLQRSIDSIVYQYSGASRLASSTSYLRDDYRGSGLFMGGYSAKDVNTYQYDANNRLTVMETESFNPRSGGAPTSDTYATQFFYPAEIVGSRTDQYLKTNLLRYLDIGAPSIPGFLAAEMGVGLLLYKDVDAGDPYVNPYQVSRVRIGDKDGYKVTQLGEPADSYLSIRLK